MSSPGKANRPHVDSDNEPRVGIIMGSQSDWGTMSAAAEMLDKFEIPHEVEVVSAHRTPERMFEYAKEARDRGLQVIIAGAGGAAHLPGMVASLTTLPVIGVPVESKTLKGIDSLYSIVQMPLGIPVATVAIGGAANAALLAAQILGTTDNAIAQKLADYRTELETMVKAMTASVRTEIKAPSVSKPGRAKGGKTAKKPS